MSSRYSQIPLSSTHQRTSTADESFSILADNKEVTVTKVGGLLQMSLEILTVINESQMRQENKENLSLLGGIEAIVGGLGVDISCGLTGINIYIYLNLNFFIYWF